MSGVYARRVILPHYVETVTCDENDGGATRVDLPNGTHYFIRPLQTYRNANRIDDSPRGKRYVFDLYPIIIRSDGAPWYEANMWIRHRLHERAYDWLASTRDLASTVDDLVAYLRFLQDENIDWKDFSGSFKDERPTYRFKTYISDLVIQKAISHSVGKRRVQTIIRFYRWLMNDACFEPAKPTWLERKIKIPVPTAQGFVVEIPVMTTDLKVKGKPKPDPFDVHVKDGGKLRPLTLEQQNWLEDALHAHGNYEVQLMHWLAWYAGARLETVLTFRRKHVWLGTTPGCEWGTVRIGYATQARNAFVVIEVGPGTGIDTKFNQKYSLYVPKWLYEALHNYVHSERATNRRKRAAGGDIDNQYLFLTEKKRQPWYRSMQAIPEWNEAYSHRRHRTGDALGHIIRTKIIPAIRDKHDPDFQYTFHWLRATFGMNELDRLVDKPKDPKLIDGPKWTLMDGLKWVQARLHHRHISTTEGYLRYREAVGFARAAQDDWENELDARVRKHAVQGWEKPGAIEEDR
ncbi:site-specific integrase [Paraburkholderia caledonica]|uniref:site-specific integrase n=1 Tax=Paraburkholderia caledonica TaxID=134536 RepID=UPI000B495286|nr:hypothetical protein BWU74_32275 [Burkholderia sp. Bk]